MDKKKLLVLVGPTAVGKTRTSISLAKKVNGEVISADSMQIYKYMNIGTAKVTSEEKEGIPHFLTDIIYPDEEFTVARYSNIARKYIDKINSKNKIPIIVGGSGLYVNSLVYELKFLNVQPNKKLRKKYNSIANLYGNEYIFEELYSIDPLSAKRINPNDRKRIIRALEVFYETGHPMSYYNKDFRRETQEYNLVMIGLTMDRSKLYSRINQRVDIMIEKGLVNEVQELLDRGYDKDLISMQGIGYKEIIPYIEGKISLDEASEILKRNTRRYAKRQLTWFRRDDRIKWMDVDRFTTNDSLVEIIMEYVNNSLTKGEEIYENDS